MIPVQTSSKDYDKRIIRVPRIPSVLQQSNILCELEFFFYIIIANHSYIVIANTIESIILRVCQATM
jgi:hypothetical protein